MLPVLLNLLLFTYCYPFSIADDHPFTGPSGPLRRDAPKYSRFTPFQDPSTFPEPVFGMGHGFPFSSDRTKSDEVIPEDHAARELGKEPHSPETSRPRSGAPPSEFSAHKESHSAEKPPPHASNEEEYQRHREGRIPMNGAHLMQGKDVRKVERRENKGVGRLLKSQKTAENNNVPKKMTENWVMVEALCQHLQVLNTREKLKRGIDRLLRAVSRYECKEPEITATRKIFPAERTVCRGRVRKASINGRPLSKEKDPSQRRFGPFGAYFERPTKPPPPIGPPPPRPLWIRNRFDSRMRKPDSESRESHRPMKEFGDSHKQEADIQAHPRSPFPATSTTVSTTPHAEKRDDPSTPAEAPVNQPPPKALEDRRQIEASKENSDNCGQRTRADNDDRVNKLIKRAVVTSVPVNTSVTSTFSPFTSENGSYVSVTNNDRRFRDLRQNSGLDCGDSSESQDSGNTTTIALTVTVTTHPPSVSSISDHVPETTTYQATPSVSNNAPQVTTQRAFFVISGVKTESGIPVTPKIEDSLIPQNSQNRTS
ncbi:unnamed protein product [Nippostrongylus brasiliensis]|uniref:Serine/arginine repetitive matrix protein 1-like n=1 Tax=Nippostrongylus brasiliensis TaxID=27835 RepID=A0A0N4XDH4_NIPBR|nr:unnamed protein product [Nippostrongylus brasiliensis]